MPYIPGCRHDLFISYASENNQDRWVEQFQESLGIELAAILGRKFVPKDSIYFDKRALQVTQDFTQELAQAARCSAILVPILSPTYLTSDWCDRERTEFFAALPHGATPAACLAPIEIRPIDPSALNSLYANAQRLSFIGPDKQTPLPAGSAEWKAQVCALAQQLADALKKIRRSYKPIYVGKASLNKVSQAARATCSAELEKRFFRTIPDESLQTFDDPLAALQQSCLAVHFIGAADDNALKAIETSADACPGPTLLFQPFGIDLTPTENQFLRDFEKQLPANTAKYQRLAGKNDQELIDMIDDQLTRSAPPVQTPAPQLQLALVCDEPDLPSVRKLKADLLALRPISVDCPAFFGARLKAMERLRKWQEFLRSAPALAFYYGVADREAIENIWQIAAENNQSANRSRFLADPDLALKRQLHPDAFWQIDQLFTLIEKAKGAAAP